jgi:hypothetical protein
MGTLHAIDAKEKGSAMADGQIYLRREAFPHTLFIYDIFGAGAAGSTDVELAQWTSSEQEFESPLLDGSRFGGRVSFSDSKAMHVIFGYSVNQTCRWLDGPAEGTSCEGGGWTIALAVSAKLFAGGFCNLRFSHIERVPALPKLHPNMAPAKAS